MASLSPEKVMYHIVKMITVIAVLVMFVVMFNSLQTQLKYDDLERYSIELREGMLSSRLTAGKYIFDAVKLDGVDQKNLEDTLPDRSTRIILDELKTCDYDYFVRIEDMKTKKEWEFGYKPSVKWGDDDGNVINEKKSVTYIGVRDQGETHVARFEVIVYDTVLGRLSCAAERAQQLREVQKVVMPHCFSTDTDSPTGSWGNVFDWPCFSLRKVDDKACFVGTDSSNREIVVTCRPNSANFNELRVTYNPKNILFYPIKEGSDMTCNSINQNAIAGINDRASKVLICPGDKK